MNANQHRGKGREHKMGTEKLTIARAGQTKWMGRYLRTISEVAVRT
jgi:hypothetical protein